MAGMADLSLFGPLKALQEYEFQESNLRYLKDSFIMIFLYSFVRNKLHLIFKERLLHYFFPEKQLHYELSGKLHYTFEDED